MANWWDDIFGQNGDQSGMDIGIDPEEERRRKRLEEAQGRLSSAKTLEEWQQIAGEYSDIGDMLGGAPANLPSQVDIDARDTLTQQLTGAKTQEEWQSILNGSDIQDKTGFTMPENLPTQAGIDEQNRIKEAQQSPFTTTTAQESEAGARNQYLTDNQEKNDIFNNLRNIWFQGATNNEKYYSRLDPSVNPITRDMVTDNPLELNIGGLRVQAADETELAAMLRYITDNRGYLPAGGTPFGGTGTMSFAQYKTAIENEKVINSDPARQEYEYWRVQIGKNNKYDDAVKYFEDNGFTVEGDNVLGPDGKPLNNFTGIRAAYYERIKDGYGQYNADAQTKLVDSYANYAAEVNDKYAPSWLLDDMTENAYKTPAGWTVDKRFNTYTDPKGKTYTAQEVISNPDLMKQFASTVTDDMVADFQILSEANPDMIEHLLFQIGDTPEVRTLLQKAYPKLNGKTLDDYMSVIKKQRGSGDISEKVKEIATSPKLDNGQPDPAAKPSNWQAFSTLWPEFVNKLATQEQVQAAQNIKAWLAGDNPDRVKNIGMDMLTVALPAINPANGLMALGNITQLVNGAYARLVYGLAPIKESYEVWNAAKEGNPIDNPYAGIALGSVGGPIGGLTEQVINTMYGTKEEQLSWVNPIYYLGGGEVAAAGKLSQKAVAKAASLFAKGESRQAVLKAVEKEAVEAGVKAEAVVRDGEKLVQQEIANQISPERINIPVTEPAAGKPFNPKAKYNPDGTVTTEVPLVKAKEGDPVAYVDEVTGKAYTVEQSIVDTANDLASSRYAKTKLDTWTIEDYKKYKEAYDAGDWDTVYSMTDDATGSQFTKNIKRDTLYSLAEEKLSQPVSPKSTSGTSEVTWDKQYESLPFEEKTRIAQEADEIASTTIRGLPEYWQMVERDKQWRSANKGILATSPTYKNEMIPLYQRYYDDAVKKIMERDYPVKSSPSGETVPPAKGEMYEQFKNKQGEWGKSVTDIYDKLTQDEKIEFIDAFSKDNTGKMNDIVRKYQTTSYYTGSYHSGIVDLISEEMPEKTVLPLFEKKWGKVSYTANEPLRKYSLIKHYNVRTGEYKGKPVWSNGEIMDFAPVPDKLSKLKDYKANPHTIDDKVVNQVIGGKVFDQKLKYIMKMEGDGSSWVIGKGTNIYKNVDGEYIALSKPYVDYFTDRYGTVSFYSTTDPKSVILVKSGNKDVGLVMPYKFESGADVDKVLKYKDWKPELPPATEKPSAEPLKGQNVENTGAGQVADLSPRQAARQEVQDAWNSFKETGIISDPKVQAEKSARFYKSLVNLAKEEIRAGAKTLEEFAERAGIEINAAVRHAWETAFKNRDISEYDKLPGNVRDSLRKTNIIEQRKWNTQEQVAVDHLKAMGTKIDEAYAKMTPERQSQLRAKAEKLERALAGNEGIEAIRAADNALKGELADAGIDMADMLITTDDLNTLLEIARTTQNVDVWNKRIAMKALEKLQIEGRRPRPYEMKQLREIFGYDVVNLFKATDKAQIGDYLTELYYNSLITVKSNIPNTVGNTIAAAFSPVERAGAALFDLPLAKLGGRERQRFFGEAAQDLYGAWSGIPDGLRAWLDVMKTGKSEMMLKSEAPTQAFKGKPGAVINFNTRLLSATDQLFKAVNQSAALRAEAYRMASLEKKTGRELIERVNTLVNDPPEELFQKAYDIAKYRLYQKQSNFADAVIKLRDVEIGKGIQPFRLIIPFVKTPTNLVKFGLERSPVGLLDPRIWQKAIKANPEAADQIAKGVIGSTIATGLFIYAKDGLITGAPPKSPAERDAFYRAGKLPYALKIGDKWVSYQRLEPFNQILVQVANVVDAINNKESEGQIDKIASNLVTSIGANLVSQTFLTGLSSAIDAITDPERYGEYWLQNQLTAAIPGSGTLRIAAQMVDTTIRQPQNIGQSAQAIIPGLSQNVPAKINTLGQEQTRETPAIIPYQWSTENNDKITQLLDKAGIQPGFAGRSITVNKQTYKLTDDEVYEYRKITGQFIEKALEPYANKGISDTKTIETVISNARDKARLDMIKKFKKEGRKPN